MSDVTTRLEAQHMNPAITIISFVSILSSVQAAKPVSTGREVTVRSLVQGSGTVVCFEHARDMGHGAKSSARGGK